MNIFFNTFYFCSFFFKGRAYGPGLKLGPRPGPPKKGPELAGLGRALARQARPGLKRAADFLETLTCIYHGFIMWFFSI